MSEKKERVPTGITGFDEITGGGFVPGSINLVSGNSGTGKTMFASAFIAHGALAYGENGLIITLEEERESIIKNGPTILRLALKKHPEKVHIFDISAMRQISTTIDEKTGITSALDVEVLKEMVDKWVKEKNVKRVAVDGIASIALRYGSEPHFRAALFRLASYLRSVGITTVVTVEADAPRKTSRFGVEEFVGDSITLLEKKGHIRSIRVLKSRGASALSGNHTFIIDESGITVYPELRPQSIQKVSVRKVKFGIEGLDYMSNGGGFSGDSTLVVGNAGTGKTIFGLQFLHEGAMEGEKGVFISFKESPAQLKRIASGIGIKMDEFIKSGLITLKFIDGYELDPNRHAHEIRELVKGKKRVVIDSLSDYMTYMPDINTRSYIFSLISFFKAMDISSLLTLESENLIGECTPSYSGISFIVDNILLLKFVEIRSEMNNSITILKMRGNLFDHSIRMFKITKKGIVIGEKFENMERVMSGTPTTRVADRLQRFFG